jgi:ketosteroid isomerase-like protein
VADDGTIESRLRRVEDLLEIQRICNEYGQRLDRCDYAGYAALFADDGEIMIGPVARAQGPAAIEEAMKNAAPGPAGNSVHIIGTPVIDLDGDTATTEVMWTVLRRGDDGQPYLAMTGRHRDDFVRVEGRWKIRKRRGFVDIPDAMPARTAR